MTIWERTSTVNGLLLRTYGSGPRLFLLLHGLGWTGELWRPVLPHLDGAKLCLLAPDLPGHGRSAGAGGAYSLEAIADQLAGLLDEPAEVVGSSWGGALALALAVRHPGRVKRLLLLDGGYFPLSGVPGATLDGLAPTDRPHARYESQEGFVAEMRTYVTDYWSDAVAAAVADQVRPVAGGAEPWLTPAVERACLESLWAHDPLADAPRLAAPVEVVAVQSPEEPPALQRFKQEAAARFGAARPGSIVHLMEETDHLTMLHRPAATARLMLAQD